MRRKPSFILGSNRIRLLRPRPYANLITSNKEASMAEVLVVTSKVKKFIKEHGGMNTSADTIEVLSKAIERLCQKGIDSAKADGRKTVMDRDIAIDHL
jgi:histone H3/H4